MLTKTLKFILPEISFKILGAGRTDAKVSALDAAFELFIEDTPLMNMEAFKNDFNKNLPSDIKIIDVSEVNESFNIIQDGKIKNMYTFFRLERRIILSVHPI